jgi:hypothetical protein
VFQRRLFWPLFAAIMGFALGGSVFWGLYGPNTTIEQADAAYEQNTAQHEAKSKKEETDEAIARYTLWLMVFTGILAVATVGLGVATVGLYLTGEQQIRLIQEISTTQSRQMQASIDVAIASATAARIQAEVARATHAASVTVVTPQSAILLSEGRERIGARFWVTLRNEGNSATQNMFGQIGMVVVGNPQQFSYEESIGIPGSDPQPMVIGPHSTLDTGWVEIRAGHELISSGAAVLFVGGWIEYDDIFPDTLRHRVEYCYVVNMGEARADGSAEWRFNLHGPHNRHYDIPRQMMS